MLIQALRLYRTLFSSLVILGTLALQAQSEPTLTRISGKLVDAPNQELKLVYNKVPFLNRPLEMRTTTDAEGRFNLIFPIDRAWPLDLQHGQNNLNLILHSGDSFYVEGVQSEGKWNYSISGPGSEESVLNYKNFRDFDRDKLEEFSILVKTADLLGYSNTIKTWITRRFSKTTLKQ